MKNNGIRVTTRRFLIFLVAITISASVIFSGAATSERQRSESRSQRSEVGGQAEEQRSEVRDQAQEKPPAQEKLPAKEKLPDNEFTRPPEKPHDPTAFFFNFDQLEYYYRVPGEFTHRLTGDQYGFESLSFIITETHPGGGPGLHVHDTEEAHILLEGNAQYRIGDKTFTVQAPYVARVPAGVPHTFINAGSKRFNLIAVFASKHPNTRRIGPNPLIPAGEKREEPRSGAIP